MKLLERLRAWAAVVGSLLLAAAMAWTAPGVVRAAQAPPATGELPDQDFTWTPTLAPRGPVLIVVSLAEQRAYVYRNGVRIGMSPVSTGKMGYETPTGVFTILQKHREHYSNLYDGAPMPYMQRLTWDGIALHAGPVTGYPASHGCIRLPYAFSERVFGVTTPGTTVIVAGSAPNRPAEASPGLFATGGVREVPSEPAAVFDTSWSWQPERSATGTLNVLFSTKDQLIVVLRNGIEIGRAAVGLRGAPLPGTFVYTLLEGTRPGTSPLVGDRPALNWLAVPLLERLVPEADPVRAAVAAGRIIVPAAFARHVYDALRPGATLIVTDEPIRGRSLVAPETLLESHEPPPARPAESGR